MQIHVIHAELHGITVYYPGRRRYALSEQIEVVPFAELARPGG